MGVAGPNGGCSGKSCNDENDPISVEKGKARNHARLCIVGQPFCGHASEMFHSPCRLRVPGNLGSFTILAGAGRSSDNAVRLYGVRSPSSMTRFGRIALSVMWR